MALSAFGECDMRIAEYDKHLFDMLLRLECIFYMFSGYFFNSVVRIITEVLWLVFWKGRSPWDFISGKKKSVSPPSHQRGLQITHCDWRNCLWMVLSDAFRFNIIAVNLLSTLIEWNTFVGRANKGPCNWSVIDSRKRFLRIVAHV